MRNVAILTALPLHTAQGLSNALPVLRLRASSPQEPPHHDIIKLQCVRRPFHYTAVHLAHVAREGRQEIIVGSINRHTLSVPLSDFLRNNTIYPASSESAGSFPASHPGWARAPCPQAAPRFRPASAQRRHAPPPSSMSPGAAGPTRPATGGASASPGFPIEALRCAAHVRPGAPVSSKQLQSHLLLTEHSDATGKPLRPREGDRTGTARSQRQFVRHDHSLPLEGRIGD